VVKKLQELQSLADELVGQHKDLRVENSYDILRTAAMLNNYLNKGYRKIGMKQNQVILLSFLLANGGVMTPTELQNKVFRTNNAIGSSLDSLDKLGLTKSSTSKTDRRIRKVTLTQKGLEVVKQILPIRRTLFVKTTNCLNKEELKTLQCLLEKLEDHLLDLTKKGLKSKRAKFYF
jgi:DNA-binding MarR family transcriptional regulator